MESDHVMSYNSDTRHSQKMSWKKKKVGTGRLGAQRHLIGPKWEESFLLLFKVITHCRECGKVSALAVAIPLKVLNELTGRFPVYMLNNKNGSREVSKNEHSWDKLLKKMSAIWHYGLFITVFVLQKEFRQKTLPLEGPCTQTLVNNTSVKSSIRGSLKD